MHSHNKFQSGTTQKEEDRNENKQKRHKDKSHNIE